MNNPQPVEQSLAGIDCMAKTMDLSRKLKSAQASQAAMKESEEQDIAESKPVNTELHENRFQLELALQSAQMGAWYLDLTENKRHFDDQVCHLLGIDPARFTGTEEEFYKALHPDDRGMLKAIWARTIEQDAPYEAEYRAVWPDGSVHYLTARGKPVHDDKGRPVRLNGIIWDTTERKRMEEKAAHLAAIVESSDDAIVGTTADGVITTWNRAAEDIYGYTAEEIIGRPISVLALNDRPDEVPAILQRISCGEDVKHFDTLRRRKDGRSIHVSLAISAIRDTSGKIMGASTIARDITERKLMEEELRKSHDELELRVQERTAELCAAVTKLEQLNEELQEFAFVASHDLQEPLRKIQAFGDILLKKHKESLNPEGQEHIGRISKAANRMSELLRALLDYSRTGTNELNFKPVSLTEVARDAASDLEIRITQAKGSVEIGELPTVQGDAPLLRQLFQNIIGNSIKFRKQSEPPIVKIHGRVADATCQVFIEDNGIGFDEYYCKKIFEPFQRLHGRESLYSGTGMGLAICKKIVARHAGNITVKSTPGQGAIFIVTLPIEQETVA